MKKKMFPTELTRGINGTSQGHSVLRIMKCMSTHSDDYLHGRAQCGEEILVCMTAELPVVFSVVFSELLINSVHQKHPGLQRDQAVSTVFSFFGVLI